MEKEVLIYIVISFFTGLLFPRVFVNFIGLLDGITKKSDKDELKKLQDSKFKESMINSTFANLIDELNSYRENHTLSECIIKIAKEEVDMTNYYPEKRPIIKIFSNLIYNDTQTYFSIREKRCNK